MNYKQIAQRFLTFAEVECKGSSPLYEYLSLQIAKDEEMLALCSNTPKGQPIPNLLFGAVHYLLLKGNEHELKSYYLSLVEQPKDFHDAFTYFKDFCHQYRAEIISILKEKYVQTNEVRRCAYLFPTFCYVYQKVKRPLALIEIGTSAGLQLLWDKYSYHYFTGEVYGKKDSKVIIESEARGRLNTEILEEIPPITARYGIDLHVNDLTNEEHLRWLTALIWPEHHERRLLFQEAAECLKENKQELNLIEGDGVALLSEIVAKIPEDAVICVFHTHVANQIPPESKQALLEQIHTIGQSRDIFHLYNNMKDRYLHLDYIVNGVAYENRVGDNNAHGKWFEWELSELLQR